MKLTMSTEAAAEFARLEALAEKRKTFVESQLRINTLLNEEKDAALAECERLRQNSDRLSGIRKLCGYVQDGSDTTVRIYQDDATRDWALSTGRRAYFAPSFEQVIDLAIAQLTKEQT